MPKNFFKFDRHVERFRQSNKDKNKANKESLLYKLKKYESDRKKGGNLKLDKRSIKSDKFFEKNLKKSNKKIRVNLKREALGIEYPDALTNLYSDSYIDKISWKSISDGTAKLGKKSKQFNYDKVYVLSQPFRLGFVDYSENLFLSDALSMFKGMGIDDLINHLETINNKMATGTGKTGTSGGEAGASIFEYGSKNQLKEIVKNAGLQTRKWRRNRRQHTTEKIGWQWFTSGGDAYITKVTPRQLLEIANAIMWHTTELNREDFYMDFYNFVKKEVPGLVLPKPKISW